jgi:signal transduction histidine kinase
MSTAPVGRSVASTSELSPRRLAEAGGDRMVEIAAVSCAAAFAAVTVLDANGSHIEVAHGFDPADPPPAALLCDLVLRDGQPVVLDDDATGLFAGVPVRGGGGELLGGLWVADDHPRRDPELAPRLERYLGVLADQLVLCAELNEVRARERRELVEERHDQKLESLGRLAAGLAHEINTPIQFVGDNVRFLAEAYQELLDLLLVYRECLDISSGGVSWDNRIKRAADAERTAELDYLTSEVPSAVQQSLEGIDRVASLVRAMKSFSYKDGGTRSYADLNAALTTTLTVVRNETKYVADVVLDLGELPEVLCHVGDLNQVFLNLLVNAADALRETGERGEIRVTTRVEDAMALISIADNGPGIPAELQRVIFEPFFTTKEVGKGTGQGLALAHSVVVDKHGGSIDLHSTPGEGTEFVLRLPVDGVPSAPA